MAVSSPLPMRHGLSAAWVRTPDRDVDDPMPWPTMGAFLRAKLPLDAGVDAMLASGRFVDDAGVAFTGGESYRPHTFVHFHRDLRQEVVVPFEVRVLYRDERIVVVDKPHFLSTIPRGRHVLQSVVVRMRQELGLVQLGPAHRLDRLTAGVLVLTTEQRWRAPYQGLFERRVVGKTYEALAPYRRELAGSRRVESHIRKDRGQLWAHEVAGAPVNAVTDVEMVERRGGVGRYVLRPVTGRTHQLRVHLNGLGAPIVGDPLYPRVREVDIDDFSTPLELVARRLEFVDPIDGRRRCFVSEQVLGASVPGWSQG